MRNVTLRPDTPQSGAGIAQKPLQAPTSAPVAGELQAMHLHPALLAVLRRRIAQATAGHHQGLPYH